MWDVMTGYPDKGRSDGRPVMQQCDLCECSEAHINGGVTISVSQSLALVQTEIYFNYWM